jgi:activator of HSP90 ATPase
LATRYYLEVAARHYHPKALEDPKSLHGPDRRLRVSYSPPEQSEAGDDMTSLNRREFAAASLVAGVLAANDVTAAEADDISRNNAAIHQELSFHADPKRLYRILTTASEFDHVVQLSGAMNSSMKTRLGEAPTAIDARPGGAFVLFGGYVTGRNIALVPDRLLVQAWRSGSWDEGLYSIAHFALQPEGAATRIIFDHTGFPNEAAAHLAQGWHENYWGPLAKYLAA